MSLKTLRLLTIVFSALTLGMHFAHTLELLPKLKWEADFYAAVQSTLYVWFARIGPILELGALLLAGLLLRRVWGREAERRPMLIAFSVMVLALITWLLLILPAQRALLTWFGSGVAPQDWMRWRDQWQFTQAGVFALHLIAFVFLLRASIKAE